MSNNGLQQIFEESVSAVTSTNSVEIGTERWEDGKKYIYMYNKSTSTALVKYGVIYSAASGYSMTASSAGGEGLAGVVVNADIGPVQYGWVCTKGHVNVYSNGASAIAQGNGVVLGATGQLTINTGATGVTAQIVGYATAGTAATATFAAFINVG